jgi:hypothetical protein
MKPSHSFFIYKLATSRGSIEAEQRKLIQGNIREKCLSRNEAPCQILCHKKVKFSRLAGYRKDKTAEAYIYIYIYQITHGGGIDL